jgi:hypothetical protein
VNNLSSLLQKKALNMKMTAFLPVAAGALAIALLTSVPAQAFTFSLGQGSKSSNEDGTTLNQRTGASALLTFDFSEVVGTPGDIKIDLTVKNTTGSPTFGAGATTSKLTGIALDLVSGVTFKSFVGNQYLDTLLTNVSFPPFGSFDIAFADNGNFLGGSPSSALPEGIATQLSFVVAAPGRTAAQLETDFLNAYSNNGDNIDIGARFQDVNAGEGSEKLLGGTPGDDDDEVTVPEPATVLGLSLIGGVFATRRRKLRQA